jgi:hypothetical protein
MSAGGKAAVKAAGKGAAAASKLFPRPFRLYDHFKLRPMRKWTDFAPYVANIKLDYDPATPGATACKCVTDPALVAGRRG